MAHSNPRKLSLADYTELRTVPAVIGVLFALSSLTLFLGGELTLAALDYSFTAEHSLLVSVASLAAAFAASDTNDFAYYREWEKGLVGLFVVLLFAVEFTSTGHSLIHDNQPYAGIIAFVWGIAAWAIVSQ